MAQSITTDWIKAIAASVAMVTTLATVARADIVGPARVIDGDTLEIAGERIRLHGIDAPEVHQTCTAYGTEWACGLDSKAWLVGLLNQREVACTERGRDRYQRIVAVCWVGGEQINALIVREGWALDFRRYSLDYVGDEDAARREGLGVWRGTFELPWEWRKAHGR